jgi:hypothetical protein
VSDETAAHGRYSLKISNQTETDTAIVCFPAIEVPAKTRVVLSFQAKADKPDVSATFRLCCGWKAVISGSARLTTEWKRYTCEGIVGENYLKELTNAGRKGVYAFQIYLSSAVKPVFKTIWIDAVQVETEKLTDYAPTKPLEAAVDLAQYPERRLLLYTVGEHDTAELRIVSYAGAAAPFRAEWKLEDVLSGAEVTKGTINGNLDETGHALALIDLPPIERRLYKIKITVNAAGETAEAQRVFGGIRDLSVLPMKSKIFGGSLETTEEARSYLLQSPDPSFRMVAWGRDPEIYLKAARRTGWRWIHTYRQTGPRMIMEAPDKFYYEDTDRFVDLLLRNDFEIMGLLTSHGNYHTQYDFPKWIQTGPASLGGTSAGKGAPLPDVEAFGRFCYEMAKRYKGKIDIWENWNEPGVKMRENEYLPLSWIAHENIKKANPNAVILGLCGTWDVGGDLYGWVKSCLKLGAGQSMDAIAIHGYHTRDRDYVSRVRELAKTITGRTYPIWDTETGVYIAPLYNFPAYFSDSDTLNGYRPDSTLIRMTQHFANEMACGVERQSWFNLAAGWCNLGKPEMSLFNFDGSPDAALIGQNFMIELYDEAKFFQEPHVEGNTIAYVFDRPGAPFAVLWNPVFESEASLPLLDLEVLDMMGGPVKVKTDGVRTTIPIGAAPCYLVAKNATPADIAAALTDIRIKGLSLIKVDKVTLGATGDQPSVVATLSSTSAEEQTVAISTLTKPDWVTGNVADKFVLPPFAKKDVSWPLAVKTPEFGDELRLGFENGAYVFTVPIALKMFSVPHTASAVAVDAVEDKDVYGTPMPLSDWVTMATAWNETGLYFFLKVKDDAIVNYKDCTEVELPTWKSDCVEFFFDWDREGDIAKSRFDGDDTQLIFLPKGSGETSADSIFTGPEELVGNALFSLKQTAMKTRRTPEGYVMEIGISWASLKALNVARKPLMGFSVSVRDHGSDFMARKRVIWAGDDKNYIDTSRFGLLLLSE